MGVGRAGWWRGCGDKGTGKWGFGGGKMGLGGGCGKSI